MRFHIPFASLTRYFLPVSVIAVAASLFFIFQRGFNFGVDFRGGVKLIYQTAESMSDGEVRSLLDPLDLGDFQVVRFGAEVERSFLVKVKYQEGREIHREVNQVLQQALGADKVTLLSEETVGPTVGSELRKRGIFAVLLTWLLILIYIGIRFDFFFAPGAVLALLHDVIIPLGFFSYLGKEVNLPILAAVLTIIGYSINDTIVIYDRVRENLRKLPSSSPLSDIVDQSLNETLSRTLVTSLTVLFAVVVLFILGGGVLHDFAFYMIIGVVAGTYSTIFIACPAYLAVNRLIPHKAGVRGIKR